jgi:hypothetical protein
MLFGDLQEGGSRRFSLVSRLRPHVRQRSALKALCRFRHVEDCSARLSELFQLNRSSRN